MVGTKVPIIFVIKQNPTFGYVFQHYSLAVPLEIFIIKIETGEENQKYEHLLSRRIPGISSLQQRNQLSDHHLKNGQLGQLYFGKKLHDRESFSHLLELRYRPMAVCTYEGDSTFSMEHIKQEYPSYGAGDMRYPAVEILQENGSRITDFVYQTHRIYDGKPALAGLPATYTEDSKEAQTLEIELKDELIHTTLILYYTIFEELPVITRSAKVIYHGAEKIVLERAMSCSVDLPDHDYQ